MELCAQEFHNVLIRLWKFREHLGVGELSKSITGTIQIAYEWSDTLKGWQGLSVRERCLKDECFLVPG